MVFQSIRVLGYAGEIPGTFHRNPAFSGCIVNPLEDASDVFPAAESRDESIARVQDAPNLLATLS